LTYVIDASVVLKWFVAEEGSIMARKLRTQLLAGEVDLVAPDMVLYEMAHVLLRKKTFAVPEVQEAVALVFRVGVAVSPPDVGQISKAIEFASRAGASVYDSAYLALASDLGCPLVTADARFAKAASALGDIRLLSDL